MELALQEAVAPYNMSFVQQFILRTNYTAYAEVDSKWPSKGDGEGEGQGDGEGNGA